MTERAGSRVRIVVILAVVWALAACGADDEDPGNGENPGATARYPDVVDVAVTQGRDGALRFDVTISSPYDGPDRYADAWRVVGPDGTVYGTRELLHDHANEQPFTRSLDGVEIPDDVEVVVVEARDLVNGWGGATVEARLPAAS